MNLDRNSGFPFLGSWIGVGQVAPRSLRYSIVQPINIGTQKTGTAEIYAVTGKVETPYKYPFRKGDKVTLQDGVTFMVNSIELRHNANKAFHGRVSNTVETYILSFGE